jgi:hypothetical protein
VAIGTAAVETVSLRCKICRGRHGTKGSLRKSRHFVAFRAQEHILLHYQPERSQRHVLVRARKEMPEQRDSASGGEDNRSVGLVTVTISGATSRSKRPRDGSIVQYTDAWDDVRARNSRAKLEKFLAGCAIALNIVQKPYSKEFCRLLNAAYTAPDSITVRKFDIPRLLPGRQVKGGLILVEREQPCDFSV